MLESVQALYERLTKKLIKSGLTISTMESCTSGLVASLISDTEGSSASFIGGNITYCNEAKIKAGVPTWIIDEFGVYSEETARSMARCASQNFSTDIGVGITGTLGNFDKANQDSKVGEVFFAIDFKGEINSYNISIEKSAERFEQKLMVAQVVGIKLLSLDF